MGREAIGSSTIGIHHKMYSYCWRNIQPTPSYWNTNLSLCKFLKYSAYPYVVGTAGASSTNLGVGTYLRNKGYLYFLRLHNTTNCTIEIRNSQADTYSSPWFSGFNNAISTTSSTGKIGYRGQFISNTAPYFNIQASAGSGYNFDGWYTATSGGSLITASTSYNAYYNYSNLTNMNNWYARTSASSYVASTNVYYGGACVSACTTTYPLSGPNLQTLYWSTSTTPQNETFSYAGGPFYLNSGLTTGISSIGSRSYSNTYVCRFISGTNQLSPASLCPGY
jgi:hypothetical protein